MIVPNDEPLSFSLPAKQVMLLKKMVVKMKDDDDDNDDELYLVNINIEMLLTLIQHTSVQTDILCISALR